MTERYKLELYIIRENELEFALYDKEAENSQGTTKMIENKLNRQDKRIKELESRLSIATQLLKQFKLYYIFMDKLEDVEEIHHWSKEEVVTDD